MLVPLFTLNLGQRLLPRRVTIGKYDGIHPCLTAATIGDKVLIHNPHNRTSLLSGRSSSGNSPLLNISLLNINQPINALCTGSLDPSKKNDVLLVGTSTSLLAYNVQDNSELFYKEVPDGVNALTVGYLGKRESPMVIAGGNCTIQGFDYHGNDPFWTVTGDNVTTLCLTDFNADGKQELLVGSEDYDIRVFQDDEIIAETSETEALSALCSLQGSSFGYALANGTVGAYDGLNRCWRIKSKNQVVSITGFDLNADGVPELITGWSNGKIDARSDKTGEVIFKDNLSSPVAGIVTGDYCLDGKTELICCSTEGEVKGYLPSANDGTYHQIDLNLEQDTIRDLIQKKRALAVELKSYEDNVKFTKSGKQVNQLQRSSSKSEIGIIPADTQLQTALTLNTGSGSRPPHVEMSISTTNDTIIRAVMIFAEGIFEGESHVVHPLESELSTKILVPLSPPRDIPIDLHVKVLVGYKGSFQYHQFEMTRQLPRFSMYIISSQAKTSPAGYVTFHVKERVQRVLLWINQNFLLMQDLELKQGTLIANFTALRSDKPLTITMESSGQIRIGTNDMSLAGEIIQAMASFLNLEDLQANADFPEEMDALSITLQQIEEYNVSRQSLMAEMADNAALVRALVVRAEDSRLLCDIKNMRQSYSELYSLNQDMLSSYKIRSNNHQELLTSLKQLNQIIQKAGQLRVGKPKMQLINACRTAVKNNDFNVLLKIIRTGAA